MTNKMITVSQQQLKETGSTSLWIDKKCRNLAVSVGQINSEQVYVEVSVEEFVEELGWDQEEYNDVVEVGNLEELLSNLLRE